MTDLFLGHAPNRRGRGRGRAIRWGQTGVGGRGAGANKFLNVAPSPLASIEKEDLV
jgi:hypothetical protein